MMRIVHVIFSFMLMTGLAVAQEETLVSGKIESGGFGGPVWKLSQIDGKVCFMNGGRGGWIINHKFIIGGGGYNTISKVKTNKLGPNGTPLYLSMEYGGLELEYIHQSQKLVHYTVQTLIGGGHVRLNERNPDKEYDSAGIYVFEGGANLEININGWLRVDLGGGYRLVMGADLEGFGDMDFSNPSASLTLKFGKF